MMNNIEQRAAPPAALARIKTRLLEIPTVARVGITLTTDHRWALKVWASEGAQPPLADVDALSEDYPIVYADEPATVPVARPAYPCHGE